MSKRVHKNLRRKYNLLVAEILGPAYYNSEMEREDADDAMCQDMLDKLEDLKTAAYGWRLAALAGWAAAVIILGLLVLATV